MYVLTAKGGMGFYSGVLGWDKFVYDGCLNMGQLKTGIKLAVIVSTQFDS